MTTVGGGGKGPLLPSSADAHAKNKVAKILGVGKSIK